MNQPTTYEQLIAQKLQELEVPDQANSIWGTIEHQLNIEMPVDGPGSGGLDNFSWGIGGKGLFTLFVAVATYISVSKQYFDNKRDAHSKSKSIEHHQPVKKKGDTAGHTMPPVTIKESNPITKPDATAVKDESAPQPLTRDSVRIAPAQAMENPSVLPLPADTVVTGKKPRGVRGITDADYRLVPSQKDSVKRKD